MKTLLLRFINYLYPQTSTKALLSMQRRIRELEAELKKAELKNAQMKDQLKDIHESVKKACSGYWWY